MKKTIQETFTELRREKRLGLFPFISAGYPDLATTSALLPALEKAGASGVEIGFPFSDPVADGPTIQESYTVALKNGVTVTQIFQTIKDTRAKITIPLIAMVSYSIVYRYGLERFVRDAQTSGINALLLPDLPPPEAQKVCGTIRAGGLDTVLLIAPTTSAERRKEIAGLCSGFIYYLSLSGITGVRDQLPENLEPNLRQLRDITDRPLCVGFGISKPHHIRQLTGLADGAIVGSAVVSKIKQTIPQTPEKIAENVAAYCRELMT